MIDNIHEVFRKLVGPINSVSEANEDAKRLNNLKNHCISVEILFDDIVNIVMNDSQAHEHSRKLICKKAEESLRDMITSYQTITRNYMPPFDGHYLCYLQNRHECGNITYEWKVLECSKNQWVPSADIAICNVVTWTYLPN